MVWNDTPHASTSLYSVSTASVVSEGTTPTHALVVELPGRRYDPGDDQRIGIRNDGVGELLFQPWASLPAGDKFVIDFAARAIKRANGTDARGELDRSVSDWWDPFVDGLRDGSNTIRALGLAAGGQATVKWRDAYLG